MSEIQYSVIIPLYNEAESLPLLWRQLKGVMTAWSPHWEAVFINDGSTDESEKILHTLAKKNPLISVITFRRNQGKATALQTGFRIARGDIIITLDADLQDDPKEIPNLVRKLDDGYDLVSGHKKNRKDPFHKTVPSYFFNRFAQHISGVPLRDINSGLKVYRRPVVEALSIYGELYRFIPILAAHQGFKVTEIPVNHRPRQFGTSKYGMTRFFRGFLDLFTVAFLTKFLKRPLHFFGSIGLVFLLGGIAMCGYLTVIHFALHASIGRRPLLIFGILFIIAGLQFICTGLIAELVTYYAQTAKQNLSVSVHPKTSPTTHPPSLKSSESHVNS